MTTQPFNNHVAEKKFINFAMKVVGRLGHDNKYFDRTCTNCGGMYSSYEVAACPKCGGQLGYITTKGGKPFAISEGTIYPYIEEDEVDHDLAAILSRKNGMPIRYRFKMFSFMDDNGVLAPHPLHQRCKTNAFMEITLLNHQPIPSFFEGHDPRYPEDESKKILWVEFLLNIYEGRRYKDTARVLSDAKVKERQVTYPVYPDGTPMPMQPQTPPPAPQPAPQTPPPTAPAPQPAPTQNDQMAQVIQFMQSMGFAVTPMQQPTQPAPAPAPQPAPTQYVNDTTATAPINPFTRAK